MNKKELIKSILSEMVYDESIRNGIWKHKTDTYQEFFHHAHGDFMPDDFRYKMIHDVLCNMDEDDQDPIDMLDSLVPIYSNDLLMKKTHKLQYDDLEEALRQFYISAMVI